MIVYKPSHQACLENLTEVIQENLQRNDPTQFQEPGDRPYQPGLLVRVVEEGGLSLGDVVHLLREEREAALHVVQVRRLQQRRPRHQHGRRARDALRVRLQAQRALRLYSK